MIRIRNQIQKGWNSLRSGKQAWGQVISKQKNAGIHSTHCQITKHASNEKSRHSEIMAWQGQTVIVLSDLLDWFHVSFMRFPFRRLLRHYSGEEASNKMQIKIYLNFIFALLRNNVPQKGDWGNVDLTFFSFNKQLFFQETWQHLLNMGYVAFLRGWVNEYVIDNFIQHVSKHCQSLTRQWNTNGAQKSPYNIIIYSYCLNVMLNTVFYYL